MIFDELKKQQAEETKQIQQAIADYHIYIFCCTEFRGMTLEQANWCWRHREG